MIEYLVPDPAPAGTHCAGCGEASLGPLIRGPDGNLWYVDGGRKVLGRVTPSGAITEFDMSSQAGYLGPIVAGPDRNIWMALNSGGSDRPDWILRITTKGAVTKFRAGENTDNSPTGFGTGPQGITAGPDGNIWFTEFFAGRIGRITPAGALTEFRIPTFGSSPLGIVTGPDRNVWFVESSRDHPAIARITPTGAITEFLLSTVPTDTRPFAIVAGPDGNLWFTQSIGVAHLEYVGRITPRGVVTMFSLPKGTMAGALAAGPDGNLWFTDPLGNAVGRMSPSGLIREFTLARRNAEPAGIVAGTDGRMWFSEAGVSRIASIGVTLPEVTLASRVVSFGTNRASSIRSVTITNTGDAPLIVGSAAIVGPDKVAFAIATDDCIGRVIAIKATCQIEVAFTPESYAGVQAARLTLTDNATGSPQTVSLTAQLPGCTLPLFAAGSPSQPVSQGEFLNLRDGVLTVDPNGGFTSDDQRSSSQVAPVLYGQLPASYDLRVGRWVPATVDAVSPDGSRYAYVVYGPGLGFPLHVVDLATGHDRALDLPSAPWAVVDFAAEGIYLVKRYEGSAPGLWLVNPDSGTIRTIFDDSIADSVSGHVAWIEGSNPADPLPPPPGIGGSHNEVLSRDLKTSETTVWMYRSGSNLYVAAAAGALIVVGGNDSRTSYLWVVSGPGQVEPITVPETGEAPPYLSRPIADANGIWLGSLDGIYLWTPHTGAFLVTDAVAGAAGYCA